MIRIVIPVHGGPTDIDACLTSIREKTTYPDYEICVVDNGSDEATRQAILKHDPAIYIRLKTNTGFSHACNLGMKTTDADIVLLNSDTIVTKGWLTGLNDAPGELVGPVTNSAISLNHWKTVKGAPKWADGMDPQAYADELAKVKGGNTTLVAHDRILSFFCVLMRRNTIESIGLMDEEFPLGLGEDNDYCIRVHEAGGKLTVANDVFVYHKHRTTFKRIMPESEYERLKTAGCNRLMKKWGRLE